MRSADSILKMHQKRLAASLCTNRWETLQRAPPHLQVDLRERGRVGTRERGQGRGKDRKEGNRVGTGKQGRRGGTRGERRDGMEGRRKSMQGETGK